MHWEGRLAGLFVLLDESSDKPRDEILLSSRKGDGLLEDALKLSDGTRAALLDRLLPEDVFDADAESLGELR
jgi:hypothetical protein